MGIWERRVLGVLALGGAFTGLVLILATLVQDATWVFRLFMVPGLAFYVWGITCGVRMLEGTPDAIEVNRWYWIVQIPYVDTPLVGGFFTSGASVIIGLQSGESLLFWALHMGSRYKLAVFDFSSMVIGVNVFALAVVAWLKHRARQAEAADAQAGAPADAGSDRGASPQAPASASVSAAE